LSSLEATGCCWRHATS